MPPGKLAAQAAHCSRLSLLKFIQKNPERLSEFIESNSCGSMITLKSSRLNDILKAYQQAIDAGLPCALFSDSQHILLPDFTGEPIITGLAIGPATREEMRHITKKFGCI